jgi:hypothetical protein
MIFRKITNVIFFIGVSAAFPDTPDELFKKKKPAFTDTKLSLKRIP